VQIVSRYFLASYLTQFAAILFASLIIIVIVEMLLNFEYILERYQGFWGVSGYLFLRLPSYYLRDLVPVTSFAATFFCLARPARLREITALRAGGISPQRAVVAVLVAAAVLSVGALVINETVVLSAARELTRLQNAGDEIAFGRGSFWYHRGDVIYNVQNADRANRTLHGVSVFELTARGRLQRSVHANLARIEDEQHWRFVSATVRTFDLDRPEAAPEVELVDETVLELGQERDLALLEASASHLSLADLRDYIGALQHEGRDATRYRAMLHTRLAEPVTVWLFALLAIPIGLMVESTRSLASSALHGVTILGGFYLLQTVASTLAAGGIAWATWSPWWVIGTFLGFGVWRFARVPR
jgi:LPS export ABC transporter permease LptG